MHEPKTDESDIDSRANNHHYDYVCDNSYDTDDHSNSAHATQLSNTIADSHILTTKQKIFALLEELQVLTDCLLQLFSQPGFITALTYTIHSASPWNPNSLQKTIYNTTFMMVDDDRTFTPPLPPASNPVDVESTEVLWPQPHPARKTIPFKKKSMTKHSFMRYCDQDLRPP